MKIFKIVCVFASISLFSFKFFSCVICNHEYEITETISATCTEDGYNLKTCNKCDKTKRETISSALGHTFNDWTVTVISTPVNDGKETRICNTCQAVESKIIQSVAYIDLSLIRANLDVSKVITCETMNELQLVFDTAVFNRVTSFEVKLNIGKYNLQDTLETLVNNCSIKTKIKVEASRLKTVTFKIEYVETATTPASNTDQYVQYKSANYSKYNSERSSNFDDFKINQSLYSYNVSTSEQLYYVLERGVLPLPKEGSIAEKIYKVAKDVLRDIIDDNMNNFEKVRAIHDYLILNVTYDNALATIYKQNPSNIDKYNGFFLEGVFIDKRAVCEGISKAFSVLCNIEGIPCVYVGGYLTNDPTSPGHAWNKVYINGKWYIVDATSDGTVINKSYEILSYQRFLITEEEMEIKYTAEMYKDLVCNTTYEAYENIKYSLNNKQYDFYIESFDELVNVIKFYEQLNPVNCSLEVKIAFNYGSSIVDEIQNAYSKLKLQASFSHTINDDILIIIK